MSACRDCGDPLRWENRVPLNADGSDHRDSCANKPPKPCKKCGAETVYRGRTQLDAGTENEHECVGLVPAGISGVARRVASMSELATYERCPREALYRWVKKLPEVGVDRTDADAGILGHSAIAYVAVVRHKAGKLADPVTGDELLAALDAVVARDRWTRLESVEQAREQLLVAAPRVDLAFAATDEKGVLVERGFEVEAGNGILVGSSADLVELVGDELVLVSDWKFSNWYDAPKASPEESFQAWLSLAWAKKMWPEREARFVFRFLVLGDVVEVPWTPERDAGARVRARAYVERRRAQRENENAWAPVFGNHCSRCPYTGLCPAFAEESKKKPPERKPVTLAEVAEGLEQAEPIASVWGKRVDELRDLGKRLAAEELGAGRGTLVAGDFELKLSSHTKKAEEKLRAGYGYQLLKVERLKGARIVDRDVKPANLIAETAADQMPKSEGGAPGAPARGEGAGSGSATPSAFSTPAPSQVENKASPAAPGPEYREPGALPLPGNLERDTPRASGDNAQASPPLVAGLASSPVVERAVAEDPDEVSTTLVPLCCSCGKGGHEHRATVFLESVSVSFHADACFNEGPHPVVEDKAPVHFVCGSCWPAVKVQLETAAREQLRESLVKLAPKPDELRETPKESAGYGESALSWPCPVEGCGKKFQNARGLGIHKRAHAPKGTPVT